MLVISATWEPEAGESLEPGRRKWQCVEIAPLHSSLGNKSENSVSKKKIMNTTRVPKQKVFPNASSFLHSLQMSRLTVPKGGKRKNEEKKQLSH